MNMKIQYYEDFLSLFFKIFFTSFTVIQYFLATEFQYAVLHIHAEYPPASTYNPLVYLAYFIPPVFSENYSIWKFKGQKKEGRLYPSSKIICDF